MANKIEVPAFDAERVKAAFVKVGERTKAAREQAAARRAELVQFNRDNLEALQQSGKIVVEGAKPLANDMVASARRRLLAAGETVKSLREVTSPVEALKLQSEAAKSSFVATQAETKAFAGSVTKLAGEAIVPLKLRFEAVVQRAQAAA